MKRRPIRETIAAVRGEGTPRSVRIRLYDADGHGRIVDPACDQGRSLLVAAEALLDVARARPRPPE